MLHSSKFVNTKAYQKAQDKKNPLKFPILSNKEVDSVPRFKTQDHEKLPRPQHTPVEAEESKMEKSKLHPSVDLDEMQRLEELHKQDDDWMSFFLGNPAPPTCSSPVTELVPVYSFNTQPTNADPIHVPFHSPVAEHQQEPEVDSQSEASAGLSPPVVLDGPTCLNEIFNDMDNDFKKTLF